LISLEDSQEELRMKHHNEVELKVSHEEILENERDFMRGEQSFTE
jgi:hypothetical protein